MMNFLCMLVNDVKRYFVSFALLFLIAIVWNVFSFGGSLKDLSWFGAQLLNIVCGKPLEDAPYLVAHQERVKEYINSNENIVNIKRRRDAQNDVIHDKEKELIENDRKVKSLEIEKIGIDDEIKKLGNSLGESYQKELEKIDKELKDRNASFDSKIEKINGDIDKKKKSLASCSNKIVDCKREIERIEKQLDFSLWDKIKIFLSPGPNDILIVRLNKLKDEEKKLISRRDDAKKAIDDLGKELGCIKNEKEKIIAKIQDKKNKHIAQKITPTYTYYCLQQKNIQDRISATKEDKEKIEKEIAAAKDAINRLNDRIKIEERNIEQRWNKKTFAFLQDVSHNLSFCAKDAAFFAGIFWLIHLVSSTFFFWCVPPLFRGRCVELALLKSHGDSPTSLNVVLASPATTIRATAPEGVPFVAQKTYVRRVMATETEEECVQDNIPFALGVWRGIWHSNLMHMVKFRVGKSSTAVSLDFMDEASPSTQFCVVKLSPDAPLLVDLDAIVGYAVKNGKLKLTKQLSFGISSFFVSRHFYYYISGDGIMVLRSKGKISALREDEENLSQSTLVVPLQTVSVATAGLHLSPCKCSTFVDYYMNKTPIYWCRVSGKGDILQMQTERGSYILRVLSFAWKLITWILGIPL